MTFFVAVVFAVVLLVLLLKWLRLERVKQKENAARREIVLSEIHDKKSDIDKAVKELSDYRSYKRYFSNYQHSLWKSKYDYIYHQLVSASVISSYYDHLDVAYVEMIKLFLAGFENGEVIRNNYNSDFVSAELKMRYEFFSNIEGRSLDEQQREIILKDEDNVLVIAGAGSGKTTTIIGKIRYLVEVLGVMPSSVLVISFTRKSAETLRQRLGVDGVDVKTFHSFAMKVVTEVEGEKPSVFDSDNFKYLISDIFDERTKGGYNYLERVNGLFMGYIKPIKSQFDFETLSDLIQYLKDYNIKPYTIDDISEKLDKSQSRNVHKTYKRHVVKSMEEYQIANCLFANQVEYNYEAPYEFKTATKEYSQWRPDFTIYEGERKVYLEHFAIKRNGDVPGFFSEHGVTYEEAKQRYHNKMAWARQTSEQFGTALIETYSYEAAEGTLLDNLKQRLIKAGISLNPLPPDKLWRFIKKNADDELDALLTLICTFITLMKSNNLSFSDLRENVKNEFSGQVRARCEYYIDMIEPIYYDYQKKLQELGQIDFNDLINKATEYIKLGNYDDLFEYIVVDEFQDISRGRYALIKAIREKRQSCKVFAVGDDWQSIYRFAGSDMALFCNFEKYFGFTVRGKIETTYRFNNPLISVSSDFIMRNPFQEKKSLKGVGAKETNLIIKYTDAKNACESDVLERIFYELTCDIADIRNKSIIVLGRYTRDLNKIVRSAALSIDEKNQKIKYSAHISEISDERGVRTLELIASFLTVHKSKGLEADIVILLNCNSGKYGFPSEMSDDSVLNLLLSQQDQFENEEERRLFYVAMTRAKERVYLIANNENTSKFVMEIERGENSILLKKCPKCNTGSVILKKEGVTKNGKDYKFYGCSNYSYGCDYNFMEWGQ